ncbi:MAG: hypothetical protein E7K72_16895 [Roseomonas mucosa]|nr:hypothetical protein [Roseomonas mucosa]
MSGAVDEETYAMIAAAVDRYRQRFGEAPPGPVGVPPDLLDEWVSMVNAATDARLSEDEMFRGLGMEPPPLGALYSAT